MTYFDLAALFLGLVGVVGWTNVRFFRLPTATVMVLAGLAGAGLLMAARAWAPAGAVAERLVEAIRSVDFQRTVLGYFLAFLLFAGSIQVSLADLRQRTLAVAGLATLGVLTSTLLVGVGLWLAAKGLKVELGLAWAIVFGALISPTDPIAVLAAVQHGKLSKTIASVLQGEALFNDGVGIVIFTASLAIAAGGAELKPNSAIASVFAEAAGGAAVGGLLAAVAIAMMRAIDDYAVEVGLSVALAAGAYALAGALGASGPIAVVVAGLLVGNLGVRTAMSQTTQRYVRGFWTLVDELLNAVLFLLLGLELLVVPVAAPMIGLWGAAIVLVLLARLAVVAPLGTFLRLRRAEPGAGLLLAWGGLHGALSLALALSLPEGQVKALVLSTTFAVVIVSVVVQGATFGPLAARLAKPPG